MEKSFEIASSQGMSYYRGVSGEIYIVGEIPVSIPEDEFPLVEIHRGTIIKAEDRL